MTSLTSGQHQIGKSGEKIFEFLSDFNHFEGLMPDKVINWTSDYDVCAFKVDGMADIGMKMEERIPHSELRIVSHGKNPFSFKLGVFIQDQNNGTSQVEMKMDADMNPMLAMMAKRPLSNLLKMMVEHLNEVDF